MTTQRPRYRSLPAIVWTLLVVGALAMPGSEIPDVGPWDWLDKPAHALLFAVHFALLVRALAVSPPNSRSLVAAALGSGLLATLMEVVQFWIPGRGWEWWDLVAGYAGIAVVALMLVGRRARLPAAF